MSSKDIRMDNAFILHGDAIGRLKELPDNCVDSIVTDPHYGLSNNNYVADTIERWILGERDFIPDGKGFMGKAWDSFVPPPAIWDECMRVLKPGGHLLAFFGTRTQDVGVLSIRLAGFEIGDSIAWVYGSGFPKSLDISKAIDKAAGAEREVIRVKQGIGAKSPNVYDNGHKSEWDITAPATEEAKQWQGWGTALKPAVEPIVVARKPLGEKTVANNVIKWGTGGLNIYVSRVGADKITINGQGNDNLFHGNFSGNVENAERTGRFPANIIFDEEAAQLLDEQADASRFFYVAKASKKDRNEGLEGLPEVKGGNMNGIETRPNKPTNHPVRQNFHPTVKPTTLMEYLIKLVTPEGGTLLDPFAGSGSTGKAALLNGFKFIGCELTEEYLPIIECRLKFANEKYAKQSTMKEPDEQGDSNETTR